jgi:DNA-binding CsgD family transcriptional regulator
MGKRGLNLNKVGICIKSQDETVEHQNELCIKTCGNQVGKKCEKGCMLHYKNSSVDAAFDRGFKLLKNLDSDGHSLDAVMFNDGQKLTTLFYDKAEVLKNQMEFIKRFSLSKAELSVIEKFLAGYKSREIADQLFISKATLRTHLNNIYKKLPANLKEEILTSHLGKEIAQKKLKKTS